MAFFYGWGGVANREIIDRSTGGHISSLAAWLLMLAHRIAGLVAQGQPASATAATHGGSIARCEHTCPQPMDPASGREDLSDPGRRRLSRLPGVAVGKAGPLGWERRRR